MSARFGESHGVANGYFVRKKETKNDFDLDGRERHAVK